ncbi:MAG TPA: hypothetical protein VGB14_02185 [Acidimicrobiales bacterium]|jgi:hypothetical protein
MSDISDDRPPDPEPDPAEVQPTDNSSGAPVDADALDEIERE